MSAPLRYARILKGLSSLISSRSAISRRTRAIAALSKTQTFGFDAEVEQPRPAAAERRRDCRLCVRRSVREQAAAATRPADLCRHRAGRAGTDDEVVDRRGRDAGRQAFAVVPLGG